MTIVLMMCLLKLLQYSVEYSCDLIVKFIFLHRTELEMTYFNLFIYFVQLVYVLLFFLHMVVFL